MSSPQTAPGPAAAAMSIRILAGALISAMVILPVVTWFVLGGQEPFEVNPLVLLAPVVAGVAVHGVLDLIGYRVPPLAIGLTPEQNARTSLEQWQSRMFLRFALAESIGILSLAAGFVVESGGWAIVVSGCAVSLVLLLIHVWPWARPVDKTLAGLEAGGATSALHEVFGRPGADGLGAGGIQRL